MVPWGDFAMFDYEAADGLLIEATKKLLWLRQQDGWAKELPRRCPPILWFGDAGSPKRKVLTIGANPSRWEYLDRSCRRALDRFKESGEESLLCYLDKPRFRVLDASSESLGRVAEDPGLRAEIMQGYNNYFLENPYRRWFGREDGYNVEGFLRGLGASFYTAETIPYQAIHIDLLPFATLSDFTKLEQMAADELFSSGWARQTVASLARLFQPPIIIVFGKTNARYLAKHVDESVSRLPWTGYSRASYQIGGAEELGAKIIGLSVNLGNPIGFSSADLRNFGTHVGELVGLHNNRP
jgi:hypothetical protein